MGDGMGMGMGGEMAFEGNGKNAKGLDGMKDPVVVIIGLSVRLPPSPIYST